MSAGAGTIAGLLVAFTAKPQATFIHAGLPLVFCVGFLDGFRVTAMERMRDAVGVTLVTLLLIAAALSVQHGFMHVAIGGLMLVPFTAALAATSARHLGLGKQPFHLRELLVRMAGIAVTVVSLLFVLEHELPEFSRRLLFTTITCAVFGLVLALARSFARWLDPRLEFFKVFGAYLRAMGVPLGGFILGFLTIVVVFTGIYSSLFRVNPESFAGLPATATFLEWFYFSLATARTVGYGDLVPVTFPAKVFVGVEAIIATGWLVVVFGAVTAYLQPRLTTLSELEDHAREAKSDRALEEHRS